MEDARTFTDRLVDLLARERVALGEFLVALAQFDERRLWVALGYASLFDFLHRELRLSKGAAFYRKAAVDLVHRFPDVIEPLRDGRLCLMTVAEVARVLTPENREQVLPRFFYLSKREAQALAATLQPHPAPPLRDVVTTAHVRMVPPALTLDSATADASSPAAVGQPVEPVDRCHGAGSQTIAPPAAPPKALALTAELNRLHVTVSRRFLRKLDAARAALSHSHPGAGIEEILEAGLDLLLDRHAKQKGLVKRPRVEPRPSEDPDHVPAHVRRAVWTRDDGKCQWPLASGGVCGSTHRVQIDHRIARARGGPPTVENLRCLCQAHNLLAARELYGDEVMDRYCRSPRSPPPAATIEHAPLSG